MPYFDWEPAKNRKLIRSRGISFEDVIIALEQGNLIDVVEHQNKKKYPDQYIIIFEVYDYVYCVPCIQDREVFFLKTIFPDRKRNKKYKKK